MTKREGSGVEILPNEPLDMSGFDPRIRETLGDGMPLMTMRAPNGAKVLIFGDALPDTPEENARRWERARETAGRLVYEAGRRAYLQQCREKEASQ